MKFSYRIYDQILRPVIPIKVTSQGKSIQYTVLIDSGADNSIFHAELAELLGIDIEKGKPILYMGIKGSPATFFLHKISIGVGDILLDTEIGFLPRRGVLSTSYGIVGQRGFFEHFAVNFDYKKEEIELIIN